MPLLYFRMQILAIITSEEMTYDLGSFFFTFQKQMEQAKSSVDPWIHDTPKSVKKWYRRYMVL